MIDAATSLKVIGRAGVGVDNVDIEAATRRGIVVMNSPTGNSVTTAEHAVTMMMALARHIPAANASIHAGKWERGKFTGAEICNKTLGVVGLGNIGRIVADRGMGLKMKVIGYDPILTAEAAGRIGVELVSLDEIFAQADFITVHTPLTDETRGIVGAAAFAKMKKGVRIINCARGGIVDEAALADALKSGKVAGAALDVFVDEPPPAEPSAAQSRHRDRHAASRRRDRRGASPGRGRYRAAGGRVPDRRHHSAGGQHPGAVHEGARNARSASHARRETGTTRGAADHRCADRADACVSAARPRISSPSRSPPLS